MIIIIIIISSYYCVFVVFIIIIFLLLYHREVTTTPAGDDRSSIIVFPFVLLRYFYECLPYYLPRGASTHRIHTRKNAIIPARTDAEKIVGHDGTTEGQGIAADIDVGPCFASHRLLEKRRQMFEVQRLMNAQKEDFCAQRRTFRRREEGLRQKDLELQESLIKFNKFLQENESKRNRAKAHSR